MRSITDEALVAGWEAKAQSYRDTPGCGALEMAVARALEGCAKELRDRKEMGLAQRDLLAEAEEERDVALRLQLRVMRNYEELRQEYERVQQELIKAHVSLSRASVMPEHVPELLRRWRRVADENSSTPLIASVYSAFAKELEIAICGRPND